ncbi:MAG: hypothetical protein QM572_03180 [Nocardioides sp.]|uniref:arsenate reductase/protein-tyrosine-phosphatase family protein n=1 Tax=Nocardioides sp. TaxID=35761 RepID=UPI0039E56184
MNVLVVCTGNLHRSPVAERLLAAALPGATVTSAGTQAPRGAPIDAGTLEQLRRLGASGEGHRARQLTPAMLEESDVVLVASLDHRQQVVSLSPRVLHRTFTLLEAAALATHGVEPEGESLADRVRSLSRHRGTVSREQLDIDDPVGQSVAVHTRVADQISRAVGPIADLLGRLDRA